MSIVLFWWESIAWPEDVDVICVDPSDRRFCWSKDRLGSTSLHTKDKAPCCRLGGPKLQLASVKDDITRYRTISMCLRSLSTLASQGSCSNGHGHNATNLSSITVLPPPWMHMSIDPPREKKLSSMASFPVPLYTLV